MNRKDYKIFSSGHIANLLLKNRLIRSATCDYQAKDGIITPEVLEIYRKLAEGGVGAVITGLMAVTPDAIGVEGQAYIYDDIYIDEIAKIASTVHEVKKDCPVIAQLCHPGRQITHVNITSICVGPSEVKSPILLKTARELSENEIHNLIKAFADAIVRVEKAGFDGVQLHAAHGYLLSSFLSPYTNHRRDGYGGNAQKRVSIIREIIKLARLSVGSFPILIKLNCDDHVNGGITKDNFAELAKEVAASGVDAIEISGAMWDCLIRTEEELGFSPLPLPESRMKIDAPERQSYYYEYVKNLSLSIPVILVGGHRNIEAMENLIKEEHLDFLSLSRPLICEPDLPNRWLHREGSENSACVSCNACFVFKEDFGCALRRKHLNRKEFEIGFSQGWRASFK